MFKYLLCGLWRLVWIALKIINSVFLVSLVIVGVYARRPSVWIFFLEVIYYNITNKVSGYKPRFMIGSLKSYTKIEFITSLILFYDDENWRKQIRLYCYCKEQSSNMKFIKIKINTNFMGDISQLSSATSTFIYRRDRVEVPIAKLKFIILENYLETHKTFLIKNICLPNQRRNTVH